MSMDMVYAVVVLVVGVVLSLLGAQWRAKARMFMRRLTEVVETTMQVVMDIEEVLKEVKDVVSTFEQALEDDQLTDEEVKRVVEEMKEAVVKIEKLIEDVKRNL